MKLETFCTRWAAHVTHWLAEEDTWNNLESGVSAKKMDPATFRVLSRQPKHKIFIFFDEDDKRPIGLVALSDIKEKSKTARLWYLLGEQSYAEKGYTQQAVNECVKYGFQKIRLKTIYAWIVKKDVESGKILENNNFNYIGCRRHCHPINETIYDRSLYDLLAEEFAEHDFIHSQQKEETLSKSLAVNS